MTERDRFEYAWREEYPLHESTIFGRSGLNPDAYVNTRVQGGWLMWQACNAAHNAGAQEPVAWQSINAPQFVTSDPKQASQWICSGYELRPLYTHPQTMPQTDASRRLSDLLARIHRDGGQYEVEHGIDKAVADADDKVARLNAMTDAARKLSEAAKNVLANGHQHDVGGGDVFLGTCDSTEQLQRALAEIERLDRAKGK